MVYSAVPLSSALTLRDTGPQLVLLRAALTRLGGCALPGPARLALAEADLALTALEAMQPGAVDTAVFTALLALAGPKVAPDLIVQMAADLRAVLVALAQGLAQSDGPRVSAQSHVLVTLAGAAGARGLQQGAQALNRAALVGDAALIRDLGPVVLAGLAALIGFVEAAAEGVPQ